MLLILLKIIGLLLLVIILVYLIIYFKYAFVLNIKSKTIYLQKPVLLSNNITERKSVFNIPELDKLILQENILRKLAYSNTTIKTNESFFNDSDMQSNYYLIIVYDKKSNTPLLSARYYFDKNLIAKCIKGDNNDNSPILNLNKFDEGELFLIDRMSANNNNIIYRKYRNYIHLLFYSQLYICNKNAKFIAMARKEKFEKLLTKYIRLGLNIIGTTKHLGKEHWVLLGDNKKNYTNTKKITLVNMFLLSKSVFFKTK